jgi:hypothetical protein
MKIWPLGIALGLFLVIAVNLAFIWIAVSNAPDVDPVYVSGDRR